MKRTPVLHPGIALGILFAFGLWACSQPQRATPLYWTPAPTTPTAAAPTLAPTPSPSPSATPLPPSATRTRTPTPSPSITPTLLPAGYFPDSEVIFSVQALDFDPSFYINASGGYLSTYRQYLTDTGWNSAAQIIQRIAVENSVNPRLLVALLEYQTGCIRGQPPEANQGEWLMNAYAFHRGDLYGQLTYTIRKLADGYYGWKENRLTQITFESGETRPLEVSLNPGSVALRVLFAHLLPPTEWESAIIQFPALYTELFGDPWGRAASIEPLTPPGLKQPELILPFEFGATWSLTAGPHPVWALSAPWGALDFAPSSSETGCIESNAWVLAAAPGVITRVGNGILALDLDFDRKEQTGWVLLYMHLRANADLQPGSTVQTEERLGHPSCDGGFTTGTHIHLARKYNGEWLPADGSLPFVLGGWTAHSSGVAYQGTLTNGSQTVTSSMYSTHDSQIVRSQPSAP